MGEGGYKHSRFQSSGDKVKDSFSPKILHTAYLCLNLQGNQDNYQGSWNIRHYGIEPEAFGVVDQVAVFVVSPEDVALPGVQLVVVAGEQVADLVRQHERADGGLELHGGDHLEKQIAWKLKFSQHFKLEDLKRLRIQFEEYCFSSPSWWRRAISEAAARLLIWMY